ncbi:MAG: hypothetical protein R2787_06920 [Saprospiraceae bacterium]
MLNINFKDVGQGDSILISWPEDEVIKIGVIDCHRYSGRNPILEEIKHLNSKSKIIFEFIIISHGHKDHYSGIIELIEYCKSNKIIVKNFISTLHPSQFQFFDIVLSLGEKQKLKELIDKINELYSVDNIIEDLFPAYNKVINFKIAGFNFECLYPRQNNYNILGNNLAKYIKGKIKTKPDLNYISTIFKLKNEQLYILFTSDCIIESLDYIQRKDEDVKNNTLHLNQVPHHGSINNHNYNFWKNRKKIEKCPAVISVGASRHNLPDEKVVSGFTELNYKIYSTNYVNGIKSYIESNKAQEDYSYLLDSFSTLEEEYTAKKKDRFRGDKLFEVYDKKVKYIP